MLEQRAAKKIGNSRGATVTAVTTLLYSTRYNTILKILCSNTYHSIAEHLNK